MIEKTEIDTNFLPVDCFSGFFTLQKRKDQERKRETNITQGENMLTNLIKSLLEKSLKMQFKNKNWQT